jgi:hypothetical protein
VHHSLSHITRFGLCHTLTERSPPFGKNFLRERNSNVQHVRHVYAALTRQSDGVAIPCHMLSSLAFLNFAIDSAHAGREHVHIHGHVVRCRRPVTRRRVTIHAAVCAHRRLCRLRQGAHCHQTRCARCMRARMRADIFGGSELGRILVSNFLRCAQLLIK